MPLTAVELPKPAKPPLLIVVVVVVAPTAPVLPSFLKSRRSSGFVNRSASFWLSPCLSPARLIFGNGVVVVLVLVWYPPNLVLSSEIRLFIAFLADSVAESVLPKVALLSKVL